MAGVEPGDFDAPSELDEFLLFACDDAVFAEILSRGEFGCCFLLKAKKTDSPTIFEMTAKFKLPPDLISQHEGKQLAALSEFVEAIKRVVDEGLVE